MRLAHPDCEAETELNACEGFSVRIIGEPAWRVCKNEDRTAVCAVCGRRVAPDESCQTATYRAERGAYIRRYHVTCSYIAKTWGERPYFKNPGTAERWAVKCACEKCVRWGHCPVNPFDCQRVLSYLSSRANALRICDNELIGEERENETDT